MQHVLRQNDVVRWAKRPHISYLLTYIWDDRDGDPILAEIIPAARLMNMEPKVVPASELTLAPVDLEDLN